MTHTPASIQWSDRISDCFDHDAGNPHPEARCPLCTTIKPCVAWGACSGFCAELLRVPLPPPLPMRRAWMTRR